MKHRRYGMTPQIVIGKSATACYPHERTTTPGSAGLTPADAQNEPDGGCAPRGFYMDAHHPRYPVHENGTIVGCGTTIKIVHVPRDVRDERTVVELAEPCTTANTVVPEELEEAFERPMTPTA